MPANEFSSGQDTCSAGFSLYILFVFHMDEGVLLNFISWMKILAFQWFCFLEFIHFDPMHSINLIDLKFGKKP